MRSDPVLHFPRSRPPVSRAPGPWGFAMTAIVVVAVGGLVLGSGARGPDHTLRVVEFSTGADDLAMLTLTDGTIVRLAPESRIRFDGNRSRREVVLEGQAYFAVAPGTHAFTVRTPAGVASVHGTRFDVRARNGDLRVVVVEGGVALSVAGEQVRLQGGEMGISLKGSAPSVVKVPHTQSMMGWMEGVLIFQSTRLDRALREIELRFDRSIQVTGNLADRTVTASFEHQSFEEVLEVVCRVVHATCLTTPTAAVLTL